VTLSRRRQRRLSGRASSALVSLIAELSAPSLLALTGPVREARSIFARLLACFSRLTSNLTMIASPALRTLADVVAFAFATIQAWHNALCCGKRKFSCSLKLRRNLIAYTTRIAAHSNRWDTCTCPSGCIYLHSSTFPCRFLSINQIHSFR